MVSIISYKGYRLGTKIGLDQAILGERDLEETVEELTDLHKNWVLGVEEEESWGRGIDTGVGNLWGVHSVRDEGGSVVYRLVLSVQTLSANQQFRTRHLSLRECEVGLGKLNKEVVRSLWASLACELLYLTNDDEERYSIQVSIHVGYLASSI